MAESLQIVAWVVGVPTVLVGVPIMWALFGDSIKRGIGHFVTVGIADFIPVSLLHNRWALRHIDDKVLREAKRAAELRREAQYRREKQEAKIKQQKELQAQLNKMTPEERYMYGHRKELDNLRGRAYRQGIGRGLY